jgi:dTDP-glucose pyrophosphorylase
MGPRFSVQWQDCCVPASATLRHVIESLNKSGLLIACMVDNIGKLLAVINDSDLRKAMLKGATLDSSALQYSIKTPVVASENLTKVELDELAISSGKREIPLIDGENRVTDVYVMGMAESLAQATVSAELMRAGSSPLPHSAFILAGGLGKRLRSVVSDRPKPLAMIGGRPLIEILVRRLIEQGFRKIYLSVNYLGNLIEEHFGSISLPEAEIHFVREERKMGTAGSISYISEEVEHPLLVCNADLLTTVSFRNAVQYHEQEDSSITCVVRPHTISVPYGVMDIKGSRIANIQEKPSFTYHLNAGIYVLNPDVCRAIPRNAVTDMPDLIKQYLGQDRCVSAYFLHEYWLDIGRPEDYTRAQSDYSEIFE